MLETTKLYKTVPSFLALCIALFPGAWASAQAAILCVNPGGTGGCYSKINNAVTAAMANDTIKVSEGTYKEDVIIGKPLSLVGADREKTMIDATGLSNGVYIDGLDHSGLSSVLISGFTIENANFEGILVTNASSVTVWNNNVIDNDKGLNVSAATCPGQPSFETSEGEDCGEGIHLIGVYASTFVGNVVENNSGGILLSDETAATHDNMISGNTVKDNSLDCGITLASHPPAASGASGPFGVVHNTIAHNESTHNGTAVPGAGAGVGIFTFLPGGTVSGNVVIDNVLTQNGLPGVAFHAHGTGENLDDNVIAGNYIAGNGADTEDALTPGTTGINVFGVSSITGTVIVHNVFRNEAEDIVTNTPALVEIHLNNFLDETLGVDNLGSGTADATANWWGCLAGPGHNECASAGGSGVNFTPWLTSPVTGQK
jgi:parallel beta-helix repeat protein